MLRHWTVLLGMSIGLAFPLAVAPSAMAGEHTYKEERKVTLEQLPEPVRETVMRETQGGNIREIEQKTKNGTTYFEVEFTTQDGRKGELKIAPDGKVYERDFDD